MLINLTGLDKMGKSTLGKLLHTSIPNCILTKEPGSPHVMGNSDIRSIVLNDKSLTPVERELMFYVDASKHRRWIEQTNSLIISDRGLWCHLAYLRGYLKTKQIDHELYSHCKYLILNQISAKPDLVIYFKGTLELMEARSVGEKKDAIESNGLEFYRYVLETYEDLASSGNYKVLTLNAEDPIDVNLERVITYLRDEGVNV